MSIEPFIKCSDITDSLGFYTDTLDFVIKVAPDPDPSAFMSKYACLERDGSLLHLSSHGGDGVFGNVIYIRVEDVDSLYERFVANGINTEDPDRLPAVTIQLTDQSWGMREFSVRDPDGNKITFGQATS